MKKLRKAFVLLTSILCIIGVMNIQNVYADESKEEKLIISKGETYNIYMKCSEAEDFENFVCKVTPVEDNTVYDGMMYCFGAGMKSDQVIGLESEYEFFAPYPGLPVGNENYSLGDYDMTGEIDGDVDVLVATVTVRKGEVEFTMPTRTYDDEVGGYVYDGNKLFTAEKSDYKAFEKIVIKPNEKVSLVPNSKCDVMSLELVIVAKFGTVINHKGKETFWDGATYDYNETITYKKKAPKYKDPICWPSEYYLAVHGKKASISYYRPFGETGVITTNKKIVVYVPGVYNMQAVK